MTNEEKFKSVDERYKAFEKFCEENNCKDCQIRGADMHYQCALCWLALEAEEEKPMPCPFCGAKCEVIGAINHRVKCSECNYESTMDSDKGKVTAAHNRVCRAVAAYNEGEVKE